MSIVKVSAKDMTQGNPIKLMLEFSMPLMLGNIFQQLYTFVDALIVGQKVGAYALAALGATEWLVFIMFGVIQGMTQGCSVVIAQHFGNKRVDLLQKYFCYWSSGIYNGWTSNARSMFKVIKNTIGNFGIDKYIFKNFILGNTNYVFI